MNKRAKKLRDARITFLSIILGLSIILTGGNSYVYKSKQIIKTSITACVNNDTEEVFKDQFDVKRCFYKYYTYEFVSEPKKSDFILTTDINQIDTTKKYTVEGYSPLVVCLKDDANLNNYLKNKTKEGFLTCKDAKKIKNTYSDNVNCDFARIIDVVLKGGDWSNLGGEDKKITIYCPLLDTVEGELFYDFLLITLNDGKYPKDNLEEIQVKAQAFLNSSNIVHTDVASKISKLGEELTDGDIYILFESDLMKNIEKTTKISVIYPEITIIKQIYLQFNNLDLQDEITSAFNVVPLSPGTSLGYSLYCAYGYRTSDYLEFTESYKKFNVQSGFNYYDLNN